MIIKKGIMNIRKKTLLALGITFIILLSIIAGISVFLYVDQLALLEQQEVTKEVRETINAISNEQDDLSNTLHDWSYWIDTNQFVIDRNHDYITQNLNEDTLSSLRVNLYMVTDNQGHIIYGKVVDPVTGSESPFPEFFNLLLPPGHSFFNHTSLLSTNTGILLTPKGPIMIVSSRVLNNRMEGPSNGILVMGRYLNEREFARISRVTGNPTSAHWSGDLNADNSQLSLLQKMNSDSSVVCVPRSDSIINGYMVIRDINGQKILIVTDQPRDLYQNGHEIIQTYLVVFIFAILVTLVIFLFIVDQSILKRLNQLTNRVRKMGQDHNDDMKLELNGSDEIALLEQAILSAHTDLKSSEQELRKFSTSLATANKKLTLLSGITRHDINNELMVQRVAIELLEESKLAPSQNEYFQKINTAAQRISVMIKFAAEYEKIGVGTTVWQNCRTLVDTAVIGAPPERVIVINDLPMGAEVFADPLIVKVLANLIDNAVRYGEKITTIRFSVEKSGDDHLIVCEDDGVGIVAADKERIFKLGFGKNTGLGLALSREILDITGIKIRETGEPGKGARFEMTVPKDMWRQAG